MIYIDSGNGLLWHQIIIWTNVESSPVMFSDIHMSAISQDVSQPSITKITFKITYLKFHLILVGANESISQLCYLVISQDLMVKYLIDCSIRPQGCLRQVALLTVHLGNQHWKYFEVFVNL